MEKSFNDSLRTPLAWFYHWESEKPGALFFCQPVNGQHLDITWGEAGEEIRRLAAAIENMNIPKGSKIALVSKNCAWWVMCDLAIMMSGHVSIPVYPNVNATTLKYILEHSEAPLLFVGKLDDWEDMQSGVPEHVSQIGFPHYAKDAPEQWSTLVQKNQPIRTNPDRQLDEVATIIYTSGTTGQPKGVVHSFKNLAYAIEKAKTVIDLGGPGARLFSYLPMAHIAERMLIELGAIYTGATVYFAESLDTFANDLQSAQPTVFLGVPRIWTKFRMGVLAKMPQWKLDILLNVPVLSGMIKKKVRSALGLTHARHCFTGAAPTPSSLLAWYKRLGISIQEVYGMTENTAYSHFNRLGEVKFGSAGQPMPEVEVRFDENDEIQVKCECMMLSYYKEPEMTANVIKGGYLCTGDEGYQDENGFLFITGRVKDIFKTEKGKYVSPSPIEMELSKNQDIEQVCVVGNLLPQPIALMVLCEEARQKNRQEVVSGLSDTLATINVKLEKHERMKKIVIIDEPWTVENEMLTPTMKMKRGPIEKKYSPYYQSWYAEQREVVWASISNITK